MVIKRLFNQQCQALKLWNFAGLILILCLGLYYFSDNHPVLFFTLNDFNWWQLFTAHFIHYDSAHMINNLMALVLLIHLFPQNTTHLTVSFIFAIIFINIYLIIEQVAFYAGLSGLLYVIPGSAAAQQFNEQKYINFLFIIGCAITYITSSIFIIAPQSNWSPLEQAHVIGFMTGLLSRIFHHSMELRGKMAKYVG